MYLEIILAVLTGYLIGSIPFALVIGKLFYKTDVREYGSNNLGGGNTGRVLGKKAGVSVMALDLLKVTFVMFLMTFITEREIVLVIAGLSAAIGHCYPVFANFKGGKAVATMYGFLFGMAVLTERSLWLFLVPLITFLIVLYIGKMVALSSMVSAVIVSGYIFMTEGITVVLIAAVIFTIMIVVRHRKNIERMIKHNENKISWM